MNGTVKRKLVQSVGGRDYVVVSGHETATRTALDVLRDQGNIVDAAIAGAAVLCGVLPHACGVGGDCFILLHQDGKSHSLNGTGRSPGGLPANVSAEQLAGGALSCSVPGMVGAWEALHRRFGSRPWRELFSPAISAARRGVEIADDFAKALDSHRKQLDADPGCRRLFLSPEARPASARVLIQPWLADTFDLLAREGARALYRGELGQSLCKVVAELGGVLSQGDLAAYEPVWAVPAQFRYRGLDICVPPPNSYGLLMLLQLAALSSISLGRCDFDSAERLRLLMTAARQAIAVGAPLLADPRIVEAAYPQMPPPVLVEQLRAALTSPLDSGSGTDSLPPSHGTALISIADKHGNGITIIQSIFTPFGSHVGDASSGIVLNNRLLGFSTNPADLNFAGPGKRPAHTLSPAMALQDGRLRLLLTTPGGTGQTITLVQILTGLVDYGLTLEQATRSARWSLDLRGNLLAEPGISPSIIRQLNAAGLPVRAAGPEHRFFFGSAECIHIGENMELTAVADNRRDAYAGGQ